PREARRRGARRRSAVGAALSGSRPLGARARASGASRDDWRRAAGPPAVDRRRGALMASLGILQPVFGAVVILAIAYACSTNRRSINWTTVAWGVSLQVVFALIVLKTSIGQRVFTTLGDLITRLLGFAGVGAAFVFGPLGNGTVWGQVMTGALGPD